MTYEININFTNKPQNLKLYIDENMQNELYVENNVLNLKEFLSLQDEKEVSKIIYWNWAEEIGDTEEEIYENDLKDSEFMGKKLQMAISVTGKQAMSANNNYYMVTLDANGGKIGSSASVQKQVVSGELYGELPIPTREGYTFMGWNGKNLINLNTCGKQNCRVENGKVYFDASHIEGNVASNLNIQFWYNDGTYATIYPDNMNAIGSSSLNHSIQKELANITIHLSTTKQDGRLIFNNSNKANKSYAISYNIEDVDFNNARATISNVQIEEGVESTQYEPYYLSPSTKVTQAKNHTLTAIWEKN